MTPFKNHVVVAAGFVALAALAVVLGSREVNAQNPGQGSAPVTIVSPLPLPVQDVDAEQREPVQFRGTPTVFTGRFGASTLVTVPAGKILVIEHVSASINLVTADGVFNCGLSIFETQGDTDFQVCHAMGHDAFNHLHAANASTKFYAGPGQTVRFSVFAIASGGGSVAAFASGYYIPAS